MDTLQLLSLIRRDPLYNYIIPGLTSYIVHEYGEDAGMIRMFVMERTQLADIAPHSHRFDFECTVLRGSVQNTIWTPVNTHPLGEPFVETKLTYLGKPGEYSQETAKEPTYWSPATEHYSTAKPFYRMTSDQVHSIRFSHDAIVLFKEGPTKSRETVMLDPWTRGKIATISKTRDWMFQKAAL